MSRNSGQEPKKRQGAHKALRRIFIVDDHSAVRSAMATLINQEPGLVVCGTAATVNRAITAIKRTKPDLVIADLNMRGKGGLELIRELKSLSPDLPVLAISIYDEDTSARQVLRAGAKAYVSKTSGAEALLRAIRKVTAGAA